MQIRSAGAELYAEVIPRDDAESVIILHGGPGVPLDMSPVAGRLAGKFQVIGFDQRGTRRSPAPGARYDMDEYVGDLDAVADHFRLDAFHLLGHSWGGLYAQIYAERRPRRVRSMLLVSPSSGTGELWRKAEAEVLAFNRRHSTAWRWARTGWHAMLGALGSDVATRSLFKLVAENYNREFDPAFEAADAMVENVRAAPVNMTRRRILAYPPLKDGVEYPFPILVVYGERDIYGESRRALPARYPKARFVEIPGAGHLAWLHNPAAFDAVLREFFGLP